MTEEQQKPVLPESAKAAKQKKAKAKVDPVQTQVQAEIEHKNVLMRSKVDKRSPQKWSSPVGKLTTEIFKKEFSNQSDLITVRYDPERTAEEQVSILIPVVTRSLLAGRIPVLTTAAPDALPVVSRLVTRVAKYTGKVKTMGYTFLLTSDDDSAIKYPLFIVYIALIRVVQ